MTSADFVLRDALEDWREEATIAHYGHAQLRDMGPTLVMPNDVLAQIVDCAHHFKIKTLDDLSRETRWDEAERYGQEVISLITEHRPAVQTSNHTVILNVDKTSYFHDNTKHPCCSPSKDTS